MKHTIVATARPALDLASDRHRRRRATALVESAASSVFMHVEVDDADACAASDAGSLRWQKIMSVREALERGTYDDPAKLDAALDRMLDAL